MKASLSSLLNAVILISMGLWGYFESESKTITALIPVIIGIILLLVNKGVKNENKALAHVAVLLTFLILLGLVKPLLGAFEKRKYLCYNSRIINDNIFLMGYDKFYKKLYFSTKNRA